MEIERKPSIFHPVARARARALSRHAVSSTVEMGPVDLFSPETRRTLREFEESAKQLEAAANELHSVVEENDRFNRTSVPDPDAQPTLFEEGELINGKDF